MLWQQLRGRRVGHKFRRQVPIGPYVVDFLCFAAKLVIEVDGRQHEAEAEYDARRSAEIEAQGFAVIRFTNLEVRNDLDGVLLRISAALRIDQSVGGTLTPALSRWEREEVESFTVSSPAARRGPAASGW